MKNKIVLKKSFFLFIFLFCTFFYGATYYVKAGGTGNGSSWDNAMGALPVALDFGTGIPTPIQLTNVQIYIAEGSYTITSANRYEYVKDNVVIQGGFPKSATGTDLSGYDPTIYITKIVATTSVQFLACNTIRGNSTANETLGKDQFATNTLTLKGILFNFTGGGSRNVFDQGGSSQYYQLKIEDCTIADSSCAEGFIGISTSGSSGKVTHWINNNKFYRNTMGATGVMDYTTVTSDVKVLFSNNLCGQGNSTDGTGFYATSAGYASYAPALSRFYIIGNIFSCGTANSTTGGIFLSTSGDFVIKNNVFLGVRGNNYGGAIYMTSISGFQIVNNYFVQNVTGTAANPGTTGVMGGAIYGTAIEKGNRVTSNLIKGNFFYENKSPVGAAISLRGADSNASRVDILSNVFAYQNSTNNDGALNLISDAVNDIKYNVFVGNKNGNSATQIVTAEISGAGPVAGVIDYNTFQLANAAAYSTNNLGAKIAAGANNKYGSTAATIGDVKAGDFVIDCYTGSVGCFKISASTAGAQLSKMGISTYKSQASNWPSKDLDGNAINNGALVLDSKDRPFVVTQVNNPDLTIGKDTALKGALTYDTNLKCLKLFDGDKWDCLAKACDKSIYDVLEYIKAHLQLP